MAQRRGHGWQEKSSFPLTSAMMDTTKPEQRQFEDAEGVPKPSQETYAEHHPIKRKDSHKPDLIANTTARLANPLQDLTEAEVIQQADEFARANDLPVDVFRKGALIAKSPHKWERMQTLTPEERQALHDETHNIYKQPWTLWNLVIACSIAAAVQGMDESVISGAQLFYPKQFGISPDAAISGSSSVKNQWLEGLVNGAPYLCCAVFGCWLTDPLNHYFGRRGTIMITCFISFATCIWGACTNTWWHFFISRFFLGVGIGPKSSTVPVLAAESAPTAIRGGMTMQWQMWTAFGIMLGYAADLAFYYVPYHKPGITGLNWRLMIGSAGFPALIVLCQMPFLPESPRWLMKKGRFKKAYESMLRLRGSPVQAARDIYYMNVLLNEEAAIVRGHNRFVELFTIGRNRRALQGSAVVMFGQQFCGVNAIVYYTATIFTQAGFSDIDALLASWGFGMLNTIFAIPTVFMIDRFGRRPLLLVTFPIMSILLLFTGFCFWIPETSRARIGLVSTGIYLYTIAYSLGEGPVPFAYSAEVYPLYVRELGMSLSTAILWLFNFVVALTFPRLLVAFKPQGAFGWYAAWCAFLFVLILFFLPESKGLTLEELDQVFSVPTAVHAKYQAKWMGRFIKKYIFRRKVQPMPPLYHRDEDDDIDDGPLTVGPDGKPLSQAQMRMAEKSQAPGHQERMSGDTVQPV